MVDDMSQPHYKCIYAPQNIPNQSFNTFMTVRNVEVITQAKV